ncbi:hypothetical protein ACP70R_018031 [Stipagrostis hirtigluma subsp. patula]
MWRLGWALACCHSPCPPAAINSCRWPHQPAASGEAPGCSSSAVRGGGYAWGSRMRWWRRGSVAHERREEEARAAWERREEATAAAWQRCAGAAEGGVGDLLAGCSTECQNQDARGRQRTHTMRPSPRLSTSPTGDRQDGGGSSQRLRGWPRHVCLQGVAPGYVYVPLNKLTYRYFRILVCVADVGGGSCPWAAPLRLEPWMRRPCGVALWGQGDFWYGQPTDGDTFPCKVVDVFSSLAFHVIYKPDMVILSLPAHMADFRNIALRFKLHYVNLKPQSSSVDHFRLKVVPKQDHLEMITTAVAAATVLSHCCLQYATAAYRSLLLCSS